ncbi:MAG: glutamine-hydrolyzing carbamoyl-phosphate synthase small subunit [Fimbriimonadaceae bacterium]|nr:glutamine-hydrolyzing carbamoyl-phosphate synthase small subunit [Fimbriimonadaceae bacterium]QYK54790.1 MAG: glutamine-hydrolyzing carbamoyl-phosphate synthase small subunit [Fimbriimonadaceae bacterium]
MDAYLALGDGTVVKGHHLGATGTATGELVFNTGMTGYQEILSDPSYAGQIVLFTYPLIGNYGVNKDDFESDRIQPTSIVVREACAQPSNWRSSQNLDAFLHDRKVVAIQGVDTRALTKRVRDAGAMMAAVSSEGEHIARAAVERAVDYGQRDFVQEVTTREIYAWGPSGREPIDQPLADFKLKMVVVDCGLKFNILRRFAALGVRSIVLPSTTSADEVMAWKPDGVLFSPGPGDPARLAEVVETARDLLGRVPVFGICLGNQVLCQAVGGRTYKLKFGHRGANHPVKDLEDGTVTITSQNHGYAVDPDSLEGTGAHVTQVNLNDGTVEGVRMPKSYASSIQYHPEAAPGPWDSRKYFRAFVEQMERGPVVAGGGI